MLHLSWVLQLAMECHVITVAVFVSAFVFLILLGWGYGSCSL